jgi:hypothetical protein
VRLAFWILTALCVTATLVPIVASAALSSNPPRRHEGRSSRAVVHGHLVAIPHFGPAVVGAAAGRASAAAVRAATSPSGTPSPPFRECPAIGADQSCGILIYVTSSGATVLSDPSQGPYDGGDDTLVGVVNASGKAISSLSLSSNTGIFGFDGDGICTYSGWPAQSGCPYGPTGYEGPGTQLDGNGGDSGTVVFTNKLSQGGVAYVGLENALTTADLANPNGYVALGDSYASGQGAASVQTQNYWFSNPVKPCVRGPGAWPIFLGTDSGGSLVIHGKGQEESFFACSGATSGEIEYGNTSAKRPNQVYELEQYRQKHGSPGLVTLTAGGDDVHFALVLEACYSGGIFNIHQCTAAITAEIVYLTRWHKSFSNKLAALYSKVAGAAGPGSRVEVVGYPKILPPWTSVFSAALHCAWIRAEPDALVLANEMADDLNDDIRQAASQAHVGYAPVEDAVAGHAMCTGDPWIAELTIHNNSLGIAGHPTKPAQESLAATVLSDMRGSGLPFARRRAALVPSGAVARHAAARPPLKAQQSTEPLTADASAVPAEATEGAPYVGYLTVTGGEEPYKWAITGGTLPAGLSLDPESGVISGEPTESGTSTVTATASDSALPTPESSSVSVTITSGAPPALHIATNTLPTASVGQSYTATVQPLGGNEPIDWSIETSELPPGLTLNHETGAISGTPTAPGTSTFTVRAADSTEPTPLTATATLHITTLAEGEPLRVATSELGATAQGAYYDEPLTATGGSGPIEWSISSGSLPAGLALDASSGAISGIATESGTFPLTITATDRSTPSRQTATKPLILSVAPGTELTILTDTISNGEQGSGYYASLDASGGTGAYTWYITEGSLPAGLLLNNSSGTIEGTPAQSGTFTFSATAHDSAMPVHTASGTYSVTIAASAPSIEFAPPPATVGEPYEYTPPRRGGVEPYSWALTTGELPTGLTLDPSTGTIHGTPTASGTTALGIRLSDSSQPEAQGTEASATITVEPAPRLQIVSSEMPSAVVGQPYRGLLLTSGGTTPLTWSLKSGSLPPGLSLEPETGVVSGTPSAKGTSKFTVQVTDSSSPTPQTQTAELKLVVKVPPKVAVATEALAEGTAGSSYSASLIATGGTSPYAWSVASGFLPPGTSLSTATGQISGTPTAAGEYSFVAKVTDSSSPTPEVATAPLTITIAAATPLAISTKAVASGVQGVYYSYELDASGGVTPYTWSLSSGSLPAGLTLDPNSGQIYGQPRAYGHYSFTVGLSDGSTLEPLSTTASYTLDIAPAAPLAVQATSLPGGTQGQYYDQSLVVSGGVQPYSISVVSGTLPDGLNIDAAGEIYGEITSAQTETFTARIEDQSSPSPQVITRQYTIEVTPAPPLELAASISFVQGWYGYKALGVTGGVPGYSWISEVGKLPAGLTYSNGTIYGTPTTLGKRAITVTVTDSATPTVHKLTKAITVIVTKPPTLTITTKTLPAATHGTYYQQPIGVTGGTPPYTWAVSAGALPAGMSQSGEWIYGTPEAPGTYSFTIKITDSGAPKPQVKTKAFRVKVK